MIENCAYDFPLDRQNPVNLDASGSESLTEGERLIVVAAQFVSLGWPSSIYGSLILSPLRLDVTDKFGIRHGNVEHVDSGIECEPEAFRFNA